MYLRTSGLAKVLSITKRLSPQIRKVSYLQKARNYNILFKSASLQICGFADGNPLGTLFLTLQT
jgi:hypothetical protein